jgi:transcriptional regulator with XRE-family HTH domain
MAKTKDFSKFLCDLIGSDDSLADDLDRERLNAEIAVLIYSEREAAGLTQKQLADKVGTHQTVIARLENAEYNGRTIELLRKVLRALGLRLAVAAEPLVQESVTADILPFEPRIWQPPLGQPIKTETLSAAQS